MSDEQLDEIIVLQAIYGVDFNAEDASNGSYSITVRPDNCSHSELYINLLLYLLPDYPSNASPEFIVSSPFLDLLAKNELVTQLQCICRFNFGRNVLFDMIEKTRHFANDYVQFTNDACSSAPSVNASASASGVGCSGAAVAQITSGEFVRDRKSVFQAHVASVDSVDQAMAVLNQLKENKKIADATHNIYAYRILDKQLKVITDCADDGETSAGSRLLTLLDVSNAENVIIVVSRWYGGIHLGPDRFRHINNVARILLQQLGYIRSSANKHRRKR